MISNVSDSSNAHNAHTLSYKHSHAHHAQQLHTDTEEQPHDATAVAYDGAGLLLEEALLHPPSSTRSKHEPSAPAPAPAPALRSTHHSLNQHPHTCTTQHKATSNSTSSHAHTPSHSSAHTHSNTSMHNQHEHAAFSACTQGTNTCIHTHCCLHSTLQRAWWLLLLWQAMR